MSQIKNIKILHRVSMLGTLALLYTVIVAIIEFPFYFKQNFSSEKVKYYDFDWSVVKIMCMYFFAFTNHNAVLHVVGDLKQPTKTKGNKIVRYAFTIEFIVYLTVSFTGYLSTFDETNEIFIDREGQSIFLLFGKILYIVSLSCHIALYCYVSKPSLEMFLNKGEQFNGSQ
jgi:amino acid permease